MIALLLSLAPASAQIAPPSWSRTHTAFNIPEQDLSNSLLTFAQQSGIQLAMNPSDVRGNKAPAISGSYAPARVLEMLLGSAPITAEWSGTNTLMIRRRALTRAVSLQRPQASAAPAEQASSMVTDPNSAGLAEIVVTARRRAESLIDTPLSVSALSATEIERYNATSFSQIALLIPQVAIERVGSGGTGAILSIRGIATSAQDSGLASSVSVEIDGTQISRGRIITAGLFDLAQVEVLKGPQALFFGKNSPAGVISIKSAGATKDFQGYVRGGYEFKADERYLEGAISGPLSDTLGFRVALRANAMQGYMSVGGIVTTPALDPGFPNAFRPYSRSPRTREILGRITLEWTPTDRFSAVLKLFGTRFKDETGILGSTEIRCANPNGLPTATSLFGGVAYADPSGDCRIDGHRSTASLNPVRAASFAEAKGGDPYQIFRAFSSSLETTYDGGSVDLSATTSFYKFHNKYFDTFDFMASGNLFAANIQKSTDFQQEIRAIVDVNEALSVMVGGFFEHESFPTRAPNYQYPLGLDPVTGRIESFESRLSSKATTWSGFGQVNYDLAPALQFSAGARYTSQSTEILGGNVYVHQSFLPFGSAAPVGNRIAGKVTDSNISPEATLTWHPSPSTTLYAAYKTGFKSGGFSQAVGLRPTTTAQTLRFKSEKAQGFEIGAKGELFDRRLRATSAIYRYNFDNLQIQGFDAPTNSYQIRNAAKARTTGAELEIAFQMTPELQLHTAGGYNVAKYTNFAGAPCYAFQTAAQGCVVLVGAVRGQNLSQRRLARAPTVSLSGGFAYDTPLSGSVNLGLTGDIKYSSSQYLNQVLNPLSRQGAFALINASVRIHDADDHWELALLGQNLTNKRYITNGIDKPLATTPQQAVSVARPRQIALQGTVRF